MTEMAVFADKRTQCPACFGSGAVADPASWNMATPDVWIPCELCGETGWCEAFDLVGSWETTFGVNHQIRNLKRSMAEINESLLELERKMEWHGQRRRPPRQRVSGTNWWHRTVYCAFRRHRSCQETGANNNRCSCRCHG